MALTTVARVEVYLGADLSSAQTVEMSLIIESVQQMMQSYCNRQFDNATYYHQRLGTDAREIVLPNTPVNEIKWAGLGMDSLMSVAYRGTRAASIEIEDQELRLSANLTTRSIDLTDSSITDVDALVAAVSALPEWTAEAAYGYGSYPCLILNPIAKCPVDEDSSYQIDLDGAASWLRLYREREGLYISDRPIPAGMPYAVIYDGGYSTVPDSLAQLATEMCAAMWRLYVQHGGGVLKRERIGDFAYELSDIVGSGNSTSVVQMFRSRLDQYARVEI